MVGFVRMWIIPKNMLIHGYTWYDSFLGDPHLKKQARHLEKQNQTGLNWEKTDITHKDRPVYLRNKIADASGC